MNAEFLHLSDRIEFALKALEDSIESSVTQMSFNKLKPLTDEALGFLRGDLRPEGYFDELVSVQEELSSMEEEKEELERKVEELEDESRWRLREIGQKDERIKALTGALSNVLTYLDDLKREFPAGIIIETDASPIVNAWNTLNPSQKAA